MPTNFRGASRFFEAALVDKLNQRSQTQRDREEERRRREEQARSQKFTAEQNLLSREATAEQRLLEREHRAGREDIATQKGIDRTQFELDDEYRALRTFAENKGYTIPEPPGGIVTESWMKYQNAGFGDYMDERDTEVEFKSELKMFEEKGIIRKELDKPEPEKTKDTSSIENTLTTEINRITASKPLDDKTPVFQHRVNEFMSMENDPYIQNLWNMLEEQNREAYENLYAEFMRIWGNTRQLSRQGTGGLYSPEETRYTPSQQTNQPPNQIRW